MDHLQESTGRISFEGMGHIITEIAEAALRHGIGEAYNEVLRGERKSFTAQALCGIYPGGSNRVASGRN